MKSLSEEEFGILRSLAEPARMSAANLENARQSEAYANLEDAKYVSANSITEEGMRALEPYRARRAIFFAAGIGSRMAPVTATMPKPLVRVNGKRIIDTLIDACIAAGIDDIVIVRGYLKDAFDELSISYPGIRFVDNPLFDSCNNVSSAYAVRNLLQNAYVFEADLLLHNPRLISLYHYRSEFVGFPTAETDDWCFTVQNGRIVNQAIGGKDCYQMVGISYWSAEDGAKLAHDIDVAFGTPDGRGLFWEQVPLREFKARYAVAIRECAAGDVTEIDTFQELCALDGSYAAYAPTRGM